ncbi:MAG: type II secretion system protein [Phycisphaerales bacterium]
MVGLKSKPGGALNWAEARRGRAFTLVELLVAIAVMTVLIGLLVPSLAGVREHARRIVCASNQRQIGLATHMFSDENKGQLPSSVFLPVYTPNAEYRPQDMVLVRLDEKVRAAAYPGQLWDGLGYLYAQQYLPAPSVYYCPSHRGEIRLDNFQTKWRGSPGEIVTNYHYRGMGPDGRTKLSLIPGDAALVSDSLRSVEELNHEGGFNVLQAGLAVVWSPDDHNVIQDLLLRSGGGSGGGADADTATTLWQALDGDPPSGDVLGGVGASAGH